MFRQNSLLLLVSPKEQFYDDDDQEQDYEEHQSVQEREPQFRGRHQQNADYGNCQANVE
jgi:hypothetical protein